MDRQRKTDPHLQLTVYRRCKEPQSTMHQLSPTKEANIIHLINGEQYSGLERIVDHLAESAPSHGYRFHFVCLKSLNITEQIKTKNAYFHHVPMRSRIDLSGTGNIRALARDIQCRLIISHTVRSAIIARILKHSLALPWVHHVHSPARYESENKYLNYVNYLAERCILPSADRLLPVSTALGKYVHRHYGISSEKITVIQNGVETIKKPITPSRIRNGPLNFGMVGLFRHRKGVEVLINSLSLVAEQGLQFQVTLIGAFVSDAYRSRVENLISELNLTPRIRITGFCSNVIEELEKIDIFIMPSLFGEGLPMALLEAMSTGKIVIASNVKGISEVVEHGLSGVLVEPGNPCALAAAINQIICDPDYGTKLAKGAKERQMRYFSLETMADRVYCAYEQYIQRAI